MAALEYVRPKSSSCDNYEAGIGKYELRLAIGLPIRGPEYW